MKIHKPDNFDVAEAAELQYKINSEWLDNLLCIKCYGSDPLCKCHKIKSCPACDGISPEKEICEMCNGSGLDK